MDALKARLAYAFPILVAALLPLAGVLLAGARFIDKDREMAVRLLMAAVLGALIWSLALTSL